MANITVSVPDDVYRAARVRAAERGSSVSSLVADYLRSLSDRDAEIALDRRYMTYSSGSVESFETILIFP